MPVRPQSAPSCPHPLLCAEAVRPTTCPDGFAGATLHVFASTITVLQGPSGCGKSRFLRALADLDPSLGTITFAGAAQTSMPAPQWRRHVVYQGAESGWWSDRVRDHFPDEESRRTSERLLPKIGLPADALTWEVGRTSTGERQRLALLRTLTLPGPRDHRVILLDEPTAALDPETTDQVEALLLDHIATFPGSALVIVSHHPDQAKRLGARTFTFHDDGSLDARFQDHGASEGDNQ